MSKGIESIEVSFAIPVTMSVSQSRRLQRLLDEIVQANQPDGGVHWLAFAGVKPVWSKRDATLLGEEARADAPADGEEPGTDDTALAFGSSYRDFADEQEKERHMRRRNKEKEVSDPYGIGARGPHLISVDDEVVYYPVLPMDDLKIRPEETSLRPRVTRLRSEPWRLGSGHWVALVKGIAGGVHITHLGRPDLYQGEPSRFGQVSRTAERNKGAVLVPEPDQLPRALPAGTWIRSGVGPQQIYCAANLVKPGEASVRHGVVSKAIYESGGTGSQTIDFAPEHVLWEALSSDEERARIRKIVEDYSALAIQSWMPR